MLKALVVATYFLICHVSAQSCYFPDDSQADGYVACAGLDGPCCAGGSGNLCLNDVPGNCLSPYGFVYREACTDSTSATECASQCIMSNGGKKISLLSSRDAMR